MRKVLGITAALILAAIGAVSGLAQGNQTFQQRWYFASDFGQWAVRGQQGQHLPVVPGHGLQRFGQRKFDKLLRLQHQCAGSDRRRDASE